MPAFLYGTAWKEDRTEALTSLALEAGFRGVDTANQRKHYVEAAVGAAVARARTAGIPRESLFLQTKFTHPAGQDHRLPYDPKADVGTQVAESFERSLEHLGTTYVDSYVLHGPSTRSGLAPDDLAAWRAMEKIHASGRAKLLGVSNVSTDQLALLCREATVSPAFVQNRCFAVTGWDREIRAFCAAEGIVYQAFSLLTANAPVLSLRPVLGPAERLGKTPSEIVFRFAVESGMLPLTGTSDEAHMRRDLAIGEFSLTGPERSEIERVLG